MRSCALSLTKSLLFLAAVMAALAIRAAPASAGKRVVVLDFKGPRGRSVRSAIVRVVRRTHVVLPRRNVMAEAKKMGVDTRCDPFMIPGIASVMKAEAVICGIVTRAGRRLVLLVQLFNGGDGKLIKKIRVGLGKRGVNARALRIIKMIIEPAVARAWSWEAVEVTAKKGQPAEQEMGQPRQAQRASSPPAAARVRATLPESRAWEGTDDENPLEESSVPVYKPEPERKTQAVVRSRPRSPRRAEGAHALQLSVGPSFLFRRNYGVNNALPTQSSEGWQTTPVGGIAISVDAYPGAWLVRRGWLTAIGLGLSYTRHFGLSWKNAGEKEDHSATHQVFAADLRGRYSFAFGQRRLTLVARAGYRHLGFVMNDTATSRSMIPDVAFNSLDLGLNADLTLLPRWLTASAYFHYMPVFGRGEIVSFEEFGPGSGSGLRFGGALQGRVVGPFGWKLQADYSRYAVRFDHHPQARRDSEGAVIARDRYLSGALFVTFTH